MKKEFKAGFVLGALLVGAALAGTMYQNSITYASEFDEVLMREGSFSSKVDTGFSQSVAGKLFIQVEENGEAWYVNPDTLTRYYLGRPSDAFQLMRDLGLGISNADISKIPDETEVYSSRHDRSMAQRLSGYILLQVEENGEAWYVNPEDLKRYYLGRPTDAFALMRTLGIGISNDDLRKIALGQSTGESNSGDSQSIAMNAFDVNKEFSMTDGESVVTMTLDDQYRYFESNGLPNHATGTFPNSGNPNTISAQDFSFRMPRYPEKQSKATTQQLPGIALNGVVMEPATAEVWNNDRDSGWNYEAIQNTLDLGLDFNNAHVQPTGTYHYHGIPESLVETDSSVEHSSLVGFAADGFPMYARYGYQDPNEATSSVILMTSSYKLKSGTRSSGPGGGYDGTFTQDYEYDAGSGTLDECNGRFAVTPEYPSGTYAYFLTDEFPFISRCLYGTPDTSFNKSGGGQAPGGQGPGFGPPPPRR